MKNKLMLTCVLVHGVFVACSTVQPKTLPNSEFERAVGSYLNADPIENAQKAMARGDLRFLAVHGYTLMVPGIEGEKFEYGIRVIPETSDALTIYQDHQAYLRLLEYAGNYNRFIHARVQEKVDTASRRHSL